MDYTKTKFIKSAQKISQLPNESQAEVAFAGRSNAGKSSVLNAITNIKGLARTSKTPGRTQLINFFQVAEHCFLVDLPGYGYAKVDKETKKDWDKTLSKYLETRSTLRGVFLIMDIRHPLQPFDVQMLEWASAQNLPVHILLNKADKLNRSPALQTLKQVRKELAPLAELVTVQLFSATTSTGVDDARAQLDQWFMN